MKKVLAASIVCALSLGSGQVLAADGEAVYKQTCFACHATGAAGAPKVRDKAAWSGRIAQGMDILKKHAIEGFKGTSGLMPAKGGRPDLSDEQVQAAVEYMVSISK